MTTFPRHDRDSARWWEALSRGELLLQRCRSCQTARWAPRALCAECTSFEWQWVPDDGTGRVASWIVSHRSARPDRETPHVVLLGALDANPAIVIPGTWAGDSLGRDLEVGAPVRAGTIVLGRDDAGVQHAAVEWRPREWPDASMRHQQA